MSDVLDYLNYNTMMDDTQELLTSDKWDVTFDRVPAAIYWPGDNFLKFRLKGIQGLGMGPFSHTPIDTNIRALSVPVQPGQIPFVNTTITWELLDYEDQSIYVMISDWVFKCCDPVTQKNFRAADLRGNFTYTRLNALNQPVRRYKHRAAMVASPTYDDAFTGDRSLIGDGSNIGVMGALFPPEFLNLPAA